MPDTSPIGDGDAATPGAEPIPALDTLTAAFQHAMIGMAVWTADGRLIDANRAFSRMFGYEHDEFLAHGFAQISHPDDPELDPGQWPRLVAGETDAYQREKRYCHKNGSILWGLVTVSALRDELGQFVGCLVQVQDITAQKAAEAAFREQEAQLETLVGQLPIALYTLPPGARAAFRYVSP
jgi:PAS domain S-box-containing protein